MIVVSYPHLSHLLSSSLRMDDIQTDDMQMDDNRPVLPTELLHEIVDTVAEDDDATSTLTALSQTNRAMRPRAQMHVYDTIKLEITDDDYIDELGRIHAADPTVLADYPRSLILYSSRNSDGSWDWDEDLADTPILETIISQMRNLQLISFRGLNVGGRPFTDSFASPSMAQITRVELHHVALSFRALNSFISSPCLTDLFLAALHVEEYEESYSEGTDFSAPNCSLPQPQSALRRPLEVLHLDILTASDFVIMDLIATSRYPIIAEDSLVRVNFSSNLTVHSQVPLFQRFLDCKAIKSAKMLRLGDHEGSFTDSDSTGYDPLRFDTFETVELHVGISMEWDHYNPEFQWWANSLSVVPAGSPLKKLYLFITFHTIDPQALADVTMDVWDDLDDALCGDNLDLEHLAIEFSTSVALYREEESAVKRWFFDCLPGTFEKYFTEGTRRNNGSLTFVSLN
ncbi:hypothetical protein EDD18DRAFT_1377055 [Armillaria luteobubalina]|uniref:Uncharacterized protein n=1 Tax=Armillaria luteobubalina TaxID=153913 RepID=A0AA39QCT8_9AGAR|nr:hypothetical protein EDD18DRAFT_1377055 [Armillaria luteobubalina]